MGAVNGEAISPLASWAAWLDSVCDAASIRNYHLARVYATQRARNMEARNDGQRGVGRPRTRPQLTRDSYPKKMVKRLRTGEVHPGAETAFRIGEALSELKVPTCGYAAAYRAGYAVDVGKALVLLADSDALSALALYAALPLSLEETWQNNDAEFQEQDRKCGVLMLRATDRAGESYLSAWNRRDLKDPEDLASFSDARQTSINVWTRLLGWALRHALSLHIDSGNEALGFVSLSLDHAAGDEFIEGQKDLFNTLITRLQNEHQEPLIFRADKGTTKTTSSA